MVRSPFKRLDAELVRSETSYIRLRHFLPYLPEGARSSLATRPCSTRTCCTRAAAHLRTAWQTVMPSHF